MRVASERTAAVQCGAVRAGSECAGSADRNHDEMVMGGMAPTGPQVAAAAHAVAPRHGAINDGEGKSGATAAPNSQMGVDGSTVACRWNSCRKIATRCQ